MLSVLAEPARTIVGTAAFSGLRRGELRGLEWPHYLGTEIRVAQSIYHGIATAPKSEASRGVRSGHRSAQKAARRAPCAQRQSTNRIHLRRP
jgi:hypothetical protein